MVHRNLLLQLTSDPSDQVSRSDSKFAIDQTGSGSPAIGTQAVIAVGVIASHVHNLSTYGRVQVTNRFP